MWVQALIQLENLFWSVRVADQGSSSNKGIKVRAGKEATSVVNAAYLPYLNRSYSPKFIYPICMIRPRKADGIPMFVIFRGYGCSSDTLSDSARLAFE